MPFSTKIVRPVPWQRDPASTLSNARWALLARSAHDEQKKLLGDAYNFMASRWREWGKKRTLSKTCSVGFLLRVNRSKFSNANMPVAPYRSLFHELIVRVECTPYITYFHQTNQAKPTCHPNHKSRNVAWNLCPENPGWWSLVVRL